MTQRVALISGVTGQDGAYLAEHLLSLRYVVLELSGDHRPSIPRGLIISTRIRMSATCRS